VQRTALSIRPTPRPLCGLIVVLGLVLSAPAQADGVAVGEASATQNDSFERKLSEGKKLLASGKFEAAISRFHEAHDIVANPKATLMIARAHRDTGELVIAHGEYLTALDEAEGAARAKPKFEETLTEIRKDLADLEGVLGKLLVKLIHAPKGTEVTVDGQPVEASKVASPLLVAPGSMAVVATAPDGQVARRQASVNAGQSATVELAFAREDEPATFFAGESSESESEPPIAKTDSDGGSNALAYVAGGVGVAGLATFVILGVAANSKFDELEKACPGGHCPPERQGDIDDGKRLQTFANVGLVVGIAGVATGAALLVFGGGKGDEPKRKPTAELGLGYRSIHVRGCFW
jgi:hypothetical protein